MTAPWPCTSCTVENGWSARICAGCQRPRYSTRLGGLLNRWLRSYDRQRHEMKALGVERTRPKVIHTYPQRHGTCTCACHRMPLLHVRPCCWPGKKRRKVK